MENYFSGRFFALLYPTIFPIQFSDITQNGLKDDERHIVCTVDLIFLKLSLFLEICCCYFSFYYSSRRSRFGNSTATLTSSAGRVPEGGGNISKSYSSIDFPKRRGRMCW